MNYAIVCSTSRKIIGPIVVVFFMHIYLSGQNIEVMNRVALCVCMHASVLLILYICYSKKKTVTIYRYKLRID